MIRVAMPRADWDTVVMILEEVTAQFPYTRAITESINHALDTQEG